MPKSYPVEFRLRAIALVRAGKSIAITAAELEISKGSLYSWVNQDPADHGQRPGLTAREHGELISAKHQIRELETELAIVRRASELFKELGARPKGASQ